MRIRRVFAVLVVLGLVAGFGWWLGQRSEPVRVPPAGAACRVDADGTVDLDRDQMANAATVTAVGVRLKMPPRAVVVALATALQESKLRNLPHLGVHNDHDSVGLFQQRPSQGWGSPEEVADPRYAAEQFYRTLRRVPDWQQMRVTDAAQSVQRSAFPEAYEQWAPDAQVLAAALLGERRAAVSCSVPAQPPARGDQAAAQLSSALTRDWGKQTTLTAVDPFGIAVSADDHAGGWRYAHWLVAHAGTHGVTRVRFADQEWTAEAAGWSRTDPASDHVVAEVAAEH